MAATTLTGTIKRRRRETIIVIITATARNNKRKVEIVRNNLNGRMITARSRQKTATEGKEITVREITITTGTEDRIRDGTTKTDVRKGDRTKNVRKVRNVHKDRNARSNKTANGNSKDRNVRNAVLTRSVLPDRKEIRIRRNCQIMKSLLKNSLFVLFSACLLTACNENTVYHSYQSLSRRGMGKE